MNAAARSARAWLVSVTLALAAPAIGAPDGGFDPLPGGLLDAGLPPPAPDAGPPLGAIFESAARAAARDRNRLGLRHTEEHHYPEALAAFREAHALDPTDAEITNNLGYLHLLLGNRIDAERYLRETLRQRPGRAAAIDNLAELLAADHAPPAALAEAADLLARLRLLRGNDPRIITRQARVAVRRGELDAARRHYDERLARAPADDPLALELGDFHRALGEPERAMAWYRRVRDPEHLGEAARRIRELEVEREARRYGWVQPTGEPPPRARTLVEQSRVALSADRRADALRLVDEALTVAPDFADAWFARGEVRAAAGADDEAEVAWLRALVSDAAHADAARRLGELYRRQERWPDAALMLTRALTLRPDRVDLHLPIARAWQAAGDLPRALRRVRLGLEALPEDAPDDALRALERELTARLPAATEVEPEQPSADPVARAIARARAHFVRGEPDAALATLRALADEHRTAHVWALEGEILLAAGRHDAAADAFRAALERDDDPEIAGRLGALLVERGRLTEGRQLLLSAVARGNDAAEVGLLRVDTRPIEPLATARDITRLPSLWSARQRLDALSARGTLPATREAAGLARDRLDDRIRDALLLTAAGVAPLVLLVVLALRRRYGGATLAELVEARPEAGPDVQRVLSAIRHEVLKHNTMALGGLVDALAAGEDAVSRAAWVRASLLGRPDRPDDDAAIHRLRAYAEQLRQIGRAHDTRLNLRHRDPPLSALLSGFALLERHGRDLDRVVTRGRAPRRLCRALDRAARRLNIEGHAATIALLDRLRVLTVDAPLLRAVFDRTAREPAFATLRLAPLDLDVAPGALPTRVAMPRAAFEDVVQNLVRNAIQASARADGEGPIAIGLAVDDELDEITFLTRVRFGVRDRAPGALTTDHLRGRRIEDGLGLTADLASRYEGSLTVEPAEAPYTKAVVLALPRLEDEPPPEFA